MKDFEQIFEAGLGGKSRSRGIPSWDAYVVPVFQEGFTLKVDRDSVLLSLGGEIAAKLSKWDEVVLLSPVTKAKGQSKFANVRTGEGVEGWTNINNLRKPTMRGGQSKEYTPDKLGLGGGSYGSAGELIDAIETGLAAYPEGKTISYIRELIEAVRAASFERSAEIPFSPMSQSVPATTIRILSKNFGEVLAALLAFRKAGVAMIEFPSDVAEMLYDFSVVYDDGSQGFFSVKSFGGSSTSIDNLKFILDRAAPEDLHLEGLDDAFEDVKMMMKTFSEPGMRTVDIIHRLFTTAFPNETRRIVRVLEGVREQHGLPPLHTEDYLSQENLNRWLSDLQELWGPDKAAGVDNEIFNSAVKAIESITNGPESILGGSMKMDTSIEVLRRPDQRTTQHGYLMYPIGSFIVRSFNDSPAHLEVLNTIANAATNLHQVTVNVHLDKIEIHFADFSEAEFRFSYNAGIKYPSNRPLGFKKVG